MRFRTIVELSGPLRFRSKGFFRESDLIVGVFRSGIPKAIRRAK